MQHELDFLRHGSKEKYSFEIVKNFNEIAVKVFLQITLKHHIQKVNANTCLALG